MFFQCFGSSFKVLAVFSRPWQFFQGLGSSFKASAVLSRLRQYSRLRPQRSTTPHLTWRTWRLSCRRVLKGFARLILRILYRQYFQPTHGRMIWLPWDLWFSRPSFIGSRVFDVAHSKVLRRYGSWSYDRSSGWSSEGLTKFIVDWQTQKNSFFFFLVFNTRWVICSCEDLIYLFDALLTSRSVLVSMWGVLTKVRLG